jgi:hypothetical protein
MLPWSPIPPDTSPEAHQAQAEAYRRMGGTARSAVMFRLTDLARRNAIAGIRERHPEYDETQVRRAFGRLVLGEDLARQVWPGVEPAKP